MDDALQAAWIDELAQRHRRALLVTAVLLSVMLPHTVVYQAVYKPDLMKMGFTYTALLVALSWAGVAASRGGRDRRARWWNQRISTLLVIYCLNTVAWDGGPASPAFFEVPLSMLAIPLIIPFTVVEVAGFQALGTLGYIGILIAHPTSADIVWLHVAILFQAAGLALASAWSARSMARGAFRARAKAEREHQRAEELLLNILPSPIAARLKEGESPIADGVDEVAVLFADVVGFTPLSARLSPDDLVNLLDRLFSRFDQAAAEAGVEKIKTIGDAYMAVAGIPSPHEDPAGAVAQLALAMREAVAALAEEEAADISIRVGIHTGPVVAGVIGRSKFAYDLWGDAVNTASRMESHSEPGRIQLTEAAADALRGRYALEERGEIEVKGKGKMRAYWLEGGPDEA